MRQLSLSSSSSLTSSSSPTPLSPSTSSAFASAQLVSPSPQPATPKRKILLISQSGENTKRVLQSCAKNSVDVDCIFLYESLPTAEELNQFQQSHVTKILCADVEQVPLPPNHMFTKQNDIIKACSDRDITGIIICINKFSSRKTIRAAEKIMEISASHSSFSINVLLLPLHKQLKIEPEVFHYSLVNYNAVSFVHIKCQFLLYAFLYFFLF